MGRYTRQFKQEAVRLVTEQGYKPAEAARKLGVPDSTYGKWVEATGWVHQSLLGRAGIVCSMSRTGNCYDNAAMESFFSTLKRELVYQHKPYATHAEARAALFEYIEAFYNRRTTGDMASGARRSYGNRD